MRPVNAIGKAAVIASGLFWGLCQALTVSKNTESGPREGDIKELGARLARMEAVLATLASDVGGSAAQRAGGVAAPAAAPADAASIPVAMSTDADSPNTGRFVTREEFAEALDITRSRIEERVAEQFERQSLAIASLRALVTDTDVLLERVLDRLESMAPERETSDSEQDGSHERVAAGQNTSGPMAAGPGSATQSSGRQGTAPREANPREAGSRETGSRESDDRILSLREPVRISAG